MASLPIDGLSVGFAPSQEAPKTEKFAMGQVFLFRKPDGTVRRFVVPITIEGPNAQIAEECRQRLLGKLKVDGKTVSSIHIKRLTVKYSDGTVAKLEQDSDVQKLREIYAAFADENKIQVSWPSHSGRPQCLIPASSRTLAMKTWDQSKIVEILQLNEEQKKWLERVDQFLLDVQAGIDKMINQDPPLPQDKKLILERLKGKFGACDRFALIASGCKVTRAQLEEALKLEEGDELEDGLRGLLLRYRKSDLTDGERVYLEDISLLHVTDEAERADGYEKVGRDVPQECFEQVLLQALNEESLDDAECVIESHPLIQGLAERLENGYVQELHKVFEAALQKALAQPPIDQID